MKNKIGTFLFRKKEIFYFIRRVPVGLQDRFATKRISFSLKTKSEKVALARSKELALRLESYWFRISLQEEAAFGRFLKKPIFTPPIVNAVTVRKALRQPDGSRIKLSEAKKMYLRLRGEQRTANFFRTVERDCNVLIKFCGNKPIDQYLRADAAAFRDHLLEQGLSGQSVVRILNTIKAILNFSTTEIGIPNNLAFSRLYIDRSIGKTDRKPISLPNIRLIQEKCFKANDEKRWAIALIADTGMRLGEAVGLLKSDFQIIDGIPAVVLKPHPWRRLKTKNSARIVPLVGSALWAKEQILRSENTSNFAFPCYNRKAFSNASSASAGLRKWLEFQVPKYGTIHGFRHSLRDRLRQIETPSDIVDQICGWTAEKGENRSHMSGGQLILDFSHKVIYYF